MPASRYSHWNIYFLGNDAEIGEVGVDSTCMQVPYLTVTRRVR